MVWVDYLNTTIYLNITYAFILYAFLRICRWEVETFFTPICCLIYCVTNLNMHEVRAKNNIIFDNLFISLNFNVRICILLEKMYPLCSQKVYNRQFYYNGK